MKENKKHPDLCEEVVASGAFFAAAFEVCAEFRVRGQTTIGTAAADWDQRIYHSFGSFSVKGASANSADPDQTAPLEGAV